MKSITLFFIAITLLSCNEKTIYDKIDRDFTDNRWQKADEKTFTFEITEQAVNFSVDILFSHVYGYQFAEVPLEAEIIYPDGKVVSNEIILKIIGRDGKHLGDCAGDYCDLTQPIISNSPLPPGKYSVRLRHKFPATFLPNVLGLGLKVKQEID